MAKTGIPDPLSRRHLVEKELDPSQAAAIAQAYLAEDRAVEAVVFLVKADAESELQALRERAIANGDAFLLKEVARESDVEPSSSDWQRLASRAEAAGLERHAELAHRQAKRGDGSNAD